MDLAGLFAVHTSPVELIVRGSFVYWFLLIVFRFVLRREAGALGIADLLFIVIVADASQNAMAGGYDTIAEGCILLGTLVFWNYAIDWAGYRWKVIRRLTEPEPLLLIDHGKIVAKNMRKEFLTRDELDAQLRQNGITDLATVRRAYMESDGKFSVLTFDAKAKPPVDGGTIPGAS